ncbi:hypothetical protein K1719_002268 [Acacia pycnantha]|nr:hypothetical protein K1719_002268 [Acacia pycnantha]
MRGEFEMSMMGELNYFLGLQIKQRHDGIFISQDQVSKDLLKKYGLADCNGARYSNEFKRNSDADEKGTNFNITKYRGMIGSLLYLTASRPDIQFSVGMCARFQSAPMESHVEHVKRIFRYLADTKTLGLWFPKDQHEHLVAYLIRIMRDTRRREKAQVVNVSSLEDH